MSTTVKPMADQLLETVASGDTLVLIGPPRRSADSPWPMIGLGVYPKGSANAVIEHSFYPAHLIKTNPDDSALNWESWDIGALTSASPKKYDVYEGVVSATRIIVTGGGSAAVVVRM